MVQKINEQKIKSFKNKVSTNYRLVKHSSSKNFCTQLILYKITATLSIFLLLLNQSAKKVKNKGSLAVVKSENSII